MNEKINKKLTVLKDLFDRAVELNSKRDVKGLYDLSLEIQQHLIKEKYLNDQLLPTDKVLLADKEYRDISFIFLDIRRKFQKDDFECGNFFFSSLSVTWDWLINKGITILR